ncbi:MAG: NAD-dependent deacylase [Clostridia bacterium]|nr:NAD-dependent deacylase [Clostridia bacterium]
MTTSNEAKRAAEIIRKANHITVFTGAGISVESGIPPFRGEGGLWSKYNPIILDLGYFKSNPKESWAAIKEIFYDFFGRAKPNDAHIAIAKMQDKMLVNKIITQNIDNLHQEAGSTNVYEYHGTMKTLTCMKCGKGYKAEDVDFEKLPVLCGKCGGLVKPDFIFFGEGIPQKAMAASYDSIDNSDAFIVIGTTGEIMPASSVPIMARANGAKIIEINIEETNFTRQITDVFIEGKATEAMNALLEELDI